MERMHRCVFLSVAPKGLFSHSEGLWSTFSGENQTAEAISHDCLQPSLTPLDWIGHDEHPYIAGKSPSEGVAGDKVHNAR